MYGAAKNPVATFRNSLRISDIAESRQLLLELMTVEPTMQHCFKIIESTCLSQGLFCKLDGKPCSPEFSNHLQDFYIPFCRNALRAMCCYGFVPWRLRKLRNNNLVPEVLPPGSFMWHTEVPKKKTSSVNFYDNSSLLVNYKITPTPGLCKEEDINVYVYVTPALDVCNASVMYATVSSPLAHLLYDYKALRQGQIRRSHADAWNTTAKVITQFSPKLRVEDNPSQYLMDFVHEDHFEPPPGAEPMYPQLEAHNVWQREQIIRRQFQNTSCTHYPEVFALPRDHTLASQNTLQPCEDIEFLYNKFRRDTCGLLGVPYEMISGSSGGGMGNETIKKTQASGRLFSTNMQDYCLHLQRLLLQIYKSIYKNDSQKCEFVLIPMPRLEITCIDDLKTLHEIGALTPDMSMKVSTSLLGERSRVNKAEEHLAKKAKKQDADEDTQYGIGIKNDY